MFLKSLTLKGFKSFADPTTLVLEPGVTVVVGPNGSGKSNVVDAIAWVLGAQAPSAVRSQKMDDVIFAGTARRPALGRAEVSLTIDNSSGLLPIAFTEVTVSRTLFRTGESEYAINGVSCRLLDVQELLSDSGVGRQQHVIVSQGQIDSVLNARPEDRRSIVEEAAGVLKFRRRKERAERRLDATEGSLLRVQDLLREVRRQLRPLERQAEAARRHGDLVAELDALRLFLAGREVASGRSRLQGLAGEQATHAASERALRTELAQLDTDVMATEARLGAVGGQDLGDVLLRVDQLRERARGIAGVLTERRRSMERDRGRLLDTGLVASLEADAARLRGELTEVMAAAAPLEAERQELHAAVVAFEAAAAVPKLPSGSEELTDLPVAPSGPTGSAGAAAEVRGELRGHRAALERAGSQAARLDQRLGDLSAREARLDDEIARLAQACSVLADGEGALVADRAVADQACSVAEAAAEQAESAKAARDAEAGRWRARADALALALDEARARAGAARLDALGGVVGTLLDLVEVDDGWEAAFEAAAGEALGAVVVDGVPTARRALGSLHDGDASGAVLALGRSAGVTPGGAGPRSDARPSVGESVRRHVRTSDAGVGELLDALIGAAVAIEGGWEAALDVALAHPDAIVVTKAGDRFGPTGWRLKVASAGATGAALEEARQRAEAAEAALAADIVTLDRAREVLAAARARLGELSERLDAHRGRARSAATALARTEGERANAATEAAALTEARDELTERVSREQARVAELEAVLPGLEADETAEAERRRSAQLAQEQRDEQAASLADRRRDLEVRSAGLGERQEFLTGRLAEVEERLLADADERAHAAGLRLALERRLAVVDRLAVVVADHRVTIESHHERLQIERRRQSEQARGIAAQLDELRRRRQDAEQRLEATRERARRVELEQAEVRVRLEATVEGLRRDLDVEPEVAMAAACPPLPEGETAAARARDLERELRLLGPVNPLALEEFTALQERHGFLEAQLEDVRSTRRDLLRVIKAVDAEIQAVFAEAFADVAANFAVLFTMLFPGGTGSLVLTQPDDLLLTGIEVEAKPSGKNVKKLSLLSGGERSLTALAFLFAVFRARPSPFYVMDEVEAALDDVNLHRFLGLIEEFRSEAQLLVVSHQKRTMEAADCLFGVTMQPGGSSKVISEKVTSTP